jgi:hypothetical protein
MEDLRDSLKDIGRSLNAAVERKFKEWHMPNP